MRLTICSLLAHRSNKRLRLRRVWQQDFLDSLLPVPSCQRHLPCCQRHSSDVQKQTAEHRRPNADVRNLTGGNFPEGLVHFKSIDSSLTDPKPPPPPQLISRRSVLVGLQLPRFKPGPFRFLRKPSGDSFAVPLWRLWFFLLPPVSCAFLQ